MDDTSRRVTRSDEFSGRGPDDPYTRVDETRAQTRDPMEELRNRAGTEAEAMPRHSGSDDDDAARRAAELRAEIADTRDEMSETIDALQDRLRPRNIVANATERIKHKTSETMHSVAESAGETASYVGDRSRDVMGGFMDTLREHPIPAALIGTGAAWWLWRSRTGSPREATDFEDRYRREGEYPYERYRESGWLDRIKNNPVPAALASFGLTWLALAGERTAGPIRSRQYAGDDDRDWSDRESPGMVDRAREYASETVSRSREYASDAADTVRRTGRRAKDQMQRVMEQNPLLIGAGALLVGAAFGLAIPETERENEWLGEARDRVVDRAQEMARDAASQVQNVATEVRDAAAGIVDAATKPEGGPA